MSLLIEEYALIGNMQTAALVGRDGAIDWLCAPRFDSPAYFAALLGTSEHGRWLVAPEHTIKCVRRTYRGETLVLETIFETDEGEVALIDFMPIKEKIGQIDIIRLVEGRKGSVLMRMELALRFDYGEVVPRLERTDDGWRAIAGPDTVVLRTPVETYDQELKTQAQFVVSADQTIPFILSRHNSELPSIEIGSPLVLCHETEGWWHQWIARCSYQGKYREQVVRSLITLKALTYHPTGAMVAAPTTSLPEEIKGSQNWDYRYCWLRDATFMLSALLGAGYREETVAWREWLIRAVSAQTNPLQIMYGLAGERQLAESELAHLPGYEGSSPVRIGNAAYEQFQLDVYGEIINALYLAHQHAIKIDEAIWRMLCLFLESLAKVWEKPDDGIWEKRGGARHFTESKVAAWVAFDRAIKLSEDHHFEGPVASWRALRETIHADVCARGFDAKRNSFVQYYGSNELDSALLRLPLVGFLPPDDPRIVGTVEAIQHGLTEHGLVKRDRKAMAGSEGAFLPCTFWLVDCLVAMGRVEEAREIYESALQLGNDVGLFSEEYDPGNHRMLGNFPQALTHVTLINGALSLLPYESP